MENWFVFGVCGMNQMYNLKDSKKLKDLHPDDTENFFLNLTHKETRRGLNPTTISDLSGIPRQTVIRNLKTLIKPRIDWLYKICDFGQGGNWAISSPLCIT